MELRPGITRNKKDTGYWSRLHRGTWHASFFKDEKYGGKEEAYKADCKYQDFIEGKFPKKVYHARRSKSKKDKLPVGVYHSHTIDKQGNTTWRFAASWTDVKTKKKHHPTFAYDHRDPADKERKKRAAIRARREGERANKVYAKSVE